jgi:hypothetical protein
MSTIDSLSAIAEPLVGDDTINGPSEVGSATWELFLAAMVRDDTVNGPSEEEKTLELAPKEDLFKEQILEEVNIDSANQTQVFSVNGGSSTFGVRPDQLLFFPPHSRPVTERFNALQKWEGYVIEVGQETFWARLTPIRGEGPDQEAEIYLDALDDADRALIEPGAVFYWSIGYLDKPSGRLRASLIRFRRLPKWTERELATARSEIAGLRSLLDAE